MSAELSPRMKAWNAAIAVSPGPLDLTVEASRIRGAVPHPLRGGRVLSNGPGWTHIGGKLAHPFDGHGYLRAFEFQNDGSVRLRAQFVQTEVYREEAAAQQLTRRGLGTNIGSHFWRNMGFGGAARNVANTTIQRWGGQLLAGWEGGPPHRIDPDSLETRGEETFHGVLHGQATLAHMKHDAVKNLLVTCSVKMGRFTSLTFREFDAAGALVTTREAPLPSTTLVHDFVVTPNWYVLASNPLSMKWGQLALTGLGASTLLQAIEANAAAPGELYLIPRRGAEPMRTVTLPGRAMVVHYGNGFEQNGAVHVDACVFHDFKFGHEFGYQGPDAALDPGLSDRRAPQRLYRISVDAHSSIGTWKQLVPHAVDFPRVHPAHEGLRTPALFGATRADTALSDPFDSVIRVDLDDVERPPHVWTAGPDVFLGEPIFVPSPENGAEGHVVVVASDGARGSSTLSIFDAMNLPSGPIAEVPLPLLPYGFHGAWDRA
jgi:all-trans-8'-apo-beta-carotenal 15,15'-oxygenase